MDVGTLSLQIQRTGPTAKLVMTVLKHGVVANVTLPQLESLTLYLADQVGRWRDEVIEAEALCTQTEQPHHS